FQIPLTDDQQTRSQKDACKPAKREREREGGREGETSLVACCGQTIHPSAVKSCPSTPSYHPLRWSHADPNDRQRDLYIFSERVSLLQLLSFFGCCKSLSQVVSLIHGELMKEIVSSICLTYELRI